MTSEIAYNSRYDMTGANYGPSASTGLEETMDSKRYT